jgi:hypothetical protein
MRRALTQMLPEDHRLIEQRSCKRWDNNEPPKYQNGRISFSPTAFLFDWVLAVGRAADCGCVRLRNAFICHFVLRKRRNEVLEKVNGRPMEPVLKHS